MESNWAGSNNGPVRDGLESNPSLSGQIQIEVPIVVQSRSGANPLPLLTIFPIVLILFGLIMRYNKFCFKKSEG